MDPSLHTELGSALLRELSDTWRKIKANHFRGTMRPPALEFSDVGSRLGQWNRARRTLSIDRRLAFEKPWSVVREVLKHEVAHEFVDEVLKIHEQAARGPAFEDVCRRFGIYARATGLPAAPSGRRVGR